VDLRGSAADRRGEFLPADSHDTRPLRADGTIAQSGRRLFGTYEILFPFVRSASRIGCGGRRDAALFQGDFHPLWFTPKFQILRPASSIIPSASTGRHRVRVNDAGGEDLKTSA